VDQTGQPYAYTGDDPVDSTDPMGLNAYTGNDPANEVAQTDPCSHMDAFGWNTFLAAALSYTFETRNYETTKWGLGRGHYVTELTSQGAHSLQTAAGHSANHVEQLESLLTKLYGFDPGFNTTWFEFLEATAATLLLPYGISAQGNGKVLYQAPFDFVNASHTAVRVVQCYVVVDLYSDQVVTSFFSTARKSIGGHG